MGKTPGEKRWEVGERKRGAGREISAG